MYNKYYRNCDLFSSTHRINDNNAFICEAMHESYHIFFPTSKGHVAYITCICIVVTKVSLVTNVKWYCYVECFCPVRTALVQKMNEFHFWKQDPLFFFQCVNQTITYWHLTKFCITKYMKWSILFHFRSLSPQWLHGERPVCLNHHSRECRSGHTQDPTG